MIATWPTAVLMLNRQSRALKHTSPKSHLPLLFTSQVQLSGNVFDNNQRGCFIWGEKGTKNNTLLRLKIKMKFCQLMQRGFVIHQADCWVLTPKVTFQVNPGNFTAHCRLLSCQSSNLPCNNITSKETSDRGLCYVIMSLFLRCVMFYGSQVKT